METLEKITADAMHMFIKLNGMHYIVRGNEFIKTHETLQQYYEYFQEIFDSLNERLVQLGSAPVYSLTKIQEYRNTNINELRSNTMDKDKIWIELLRDFEIISNSLKNIIKVYVKEDDFVTEDLLRGYKAWIEKQLWMIKSSI